MLITLAAFGKSVCKRASDRRKAAHRQRTRFGAAEILECRTLLSGFSFTDFSDASSLNLLGDASVTADHVLRLTPAVGGQAGAAWYSAEQQYVSVPWETTFQFQMTENADAPGGSDGFTFAIQNVSPEELRGGGGNLGYNGLPNSLVIEFDTYLNGDFGDPSHSHISVHTRGTDHNSVDEAFSIGAYDTTQASLYLDDTQVHTARIFYETGTMQVFLNDMTTPVLTVAVDLAETLDLNGGQAWIGFTAATGGGWQNHDILNWSYQTLVDTSTTVSIDDVSQIEGDSGTSEFVFTIARQGDTTGMATVNWATADGTATSGSDFAAASGQVTFASGETAKAVHIAVNGDTAEEPHETFVVRLSDAVGAIIADGHGTGTILNDETSISITDAMVTEGDASIRFIDAFISANSGGLDIPRGITFGPDGDLYAASSSSVSVVRFDGVTGAFLGRFAEAHELATGAGTVLFHEGHLYLSTGHNDGVLRFDGATGSPLPSPSRTGADFIAPGAGGLDAAWGMDFGPDGNLYVTSRWTHEVLKYDGSTGDFLGVYVSSGSGGLSEPPAAVFGQDGHLYVSSNGNSAVLRYQGPLSEAPGAFIDEFVASGSGGLGLMGSASLTFGPDGDFYVSNQTDDSVLRYNGSTGAFVEVAVASGAGELTGVTGIAFDNAGLFYASSRDSDEILRYAPASHAVFTISLSQSSGETVTVNYTTFDGTAQAGSDYVAASGTITFAPGQTTRTILVPTVDDTITEATETFTINLSDPINAMIVDSQAMGTILDDDLATKFFVVDASADRTFEYAADGQAIRNNPLGSGNTEARGVASDATGQRTWVIDNNDFVYVYDVAGTLLGSWKASGLNTPEGIASNGTDLWIVDRGSDRVYRFAGAASRTAGTVSASSSFALHKQNKEARGIETDGTSLWVVDEARTDKVFKYTISGSHLGNWSIDSLNSTPTGITLDPSAPSHVWIVDAGRDQVFQYNAAASRTSGSQSASAVFNLAAGNTNPQGIADPPVSGSATLSEPTGRESGETLPADLPASSQSWSAVAEPGRSPRTNGASSSELDRLVELILGEESKPSDRLGSASRRSWLVRGSEAEPSSVLEETRQLDGLFSGLESKLLNDLLAI